MSEYYIGVDVGTTGVKVAFVDGAGNLARVEVMPHATRHLQPGWAEQDPNEWWSSVTSGINRILAETNIDETTIKGIGVTSMTPCLLGVDAYGEAFLCHIWADQRASGEAEEMRRGVGDNRYVEICGNGVKTGYLAPKIIWLKKNMPEVYGLVRYFLNPSAYIAYRMTGVPSISRADCEISLLHDKHTGEVDAGLCGHFGIDPEKLPPTKRCDAILGYLTEKAASEFCLPTGIPVAVGGHDSPAAAYALGVVEPGDMFLDIGNAANLGRCVDDPVSTPSGDLYHHSIGDVWILQVYAAAAGSSYRWFLELFGGVERAWAELGGGNPYALLDGQAELSPPGANGVLFLPYLLGLQLHSEATGSFLRLRASTTRKDMARAVLEGCALAIRRNLDEIESAAGVSEQAIFLGGGGSKSDLWNQICADIIGRTLHVTAIRDAAATGAAMLAARAVGRDLPRQKAVKSYQPRRENKSVYDQRYGEFLAAFEY